MNAILFKRILISVLTILAIGSVGSYFLLLANLKERVVETDHVKIDADISSNDIDHLKSLQQQLSGLQDVVARTKEIVATSADYKYQDQVITDINHLAAANGVTVTGYSFPTAAAVGTTSTVSSGAGLTAPPVAGAKLLTIAITMKSPMPYDNYLKFLRSVELNLTRFQVTGVDLSPDPANPTQITNPSIGIQIYVKS
jgi:hypothetical protein